MFEISKIIYYLQRNGNCKVYFYEPSFGNQRVNPVLDMSFDERGELDIVSRMEIFSKKPRWDGKKLNGVSPIETVPILEKDRLKLETRIAAIIASEFHGNKVAVTTKEKAKKFKISEEDIKEMYSIATKMISNWSSKDFTTALLEGHLAIIETLLAKKDQELPEEDCCFDYMAALMDGKMATFLTKERMVLGSLMKLYEDEPNITR